MNNKLCVSITNGANDPDRATVGFVVANAGAGSDVETIVFLSCDGVNLAVKGYAEKIHEEGFAPLKDLMENFNGAGGKLYVCSPCFKKRGLKEDQLVDGVMIVGGAKLIEFLDGSTPTICY